MDDLHEGALTIQVSEQRESMTLTWLGKSIEREPARFLAPFFRAVMEHCEQTKRGIVMHFEKLEYFNSATVSVLIRLIQEARDKHLSHTIFYNSQASWQSLSFDALRAIAAIDPTLHLRPVLGTSMP